MMDPNGIDFSGMLETASKFYLGLLNYFSWDNYSIMGEGYASNGWILMTTIIAIAGWIVLYISYKEQE